MIMPYTVNLADVNLSHIHLVGGKNASTGEMIGNLSKLGVKVPGGFAITAEAYRKFLTQNNLDTKITKLLSKLNAKNITQLEKISLQIRKLIIAAPLFRELEDEIISAYHKLKKPAVAVRSSATIEDLAHASSAGQQETYLNITGSKQVLRAVKLVYASLFTSRAIAYRQHHGFHHDKVAISVGIQPMVRSDKGASGVLFTLDTESGFDQVILINSSYGLGESVVQGKVSPDEFYLYKPALQAGKLSILQRQLGKKAVKMIYTTDKNPKKSVKMVPVALADQNKFSLTDNELELLAKQALIIEKHYGKPMDIEWAKDGLTGQIYIVQARPETVKSREKPGAALERYELKKKGKVLVTGQSVGQRIDSGEAKIIKDAKNMGAMKPGCVLVTDMTDPDWEPIMKLASAIVTNRGGRTCHAAIIARELGIPAVVGCGNATEVIKNNKMLTVSCAEGQTGYIYEGKLPFHVEHVPISKINALPTKICINIGNPERAFSVQSLPNDGVGLARIEFIINGIGIHPKAALDYSKLPKKLQVEIKNKTASYKNPVEYYVKKLTEGIATLAAAFAPKQVIFRFSDFKSNEYANLLGGSLYEPHEENPMIGYRGASRYVSPMFKPCFELECKAIKQVREKMGLVNAQVMIPFVRTVAELKETSAVMNAYGLKRGEHGLKVYMMCEIPSNVLLAEEFLQHVDGYSIGSNDLTQLTLGLDRDSSLVAPLFDERNAAVKMLIKNAIEVCNRMDKYIGICGQAPSDYPELAKWLMEQGIQYMSLNPDTVVDTWLMLAEQHKNK